MSSRKEKAAPLPTSKTQSTDCAAKERGLLAVRLWISINGQLYDLERLKISPEVGTIAWRLGLPNETKHDIYLSKTGAECSCPDFIYRRNHKQPEGCKHLQALRLKGLLPALKGGMNEAFKEATKDVQ